MSIKILKIYYPWYNQNDLILRSYSDTEMWSFRYQKISTGKWFDCNASGNDIKNNKLSCDGNGILSSDYEIWKEAIIEWINENNRKIYEGDLSEYEISYKMIDVDEDYAYTYEKYVNGNLAKEGKGWLKDLLTEQEKDAWRKGVREYKKQKNIKTESDKRKEKKEKTKKKIKEQDENLPQEKPLVPPTLVDALSKAESEPCEFVTEILQKGIQGVTGISIKELSNYYTELAKHNVNVVKNQAINGTTGIIEQFYEPVEECLDNVEGFFEQLDTEREEWLKQHSDDVCLFKMVEYESPSLETTQTSQEEYVPERQPAQKGTLEWHNKGANENVITQPGKLWNIIRTDLGAIPTEAEAKGSMTTIAVKAKDQNGVIHEYKFMVHKAAAGTMKKIFNELLQLDTSDFYVDPRSKSLEQSVNGTINGFKHRPVRVKDPNNPGGPWIPATPYRLSNHSFGCAIDLNRHKNKWSDNRNEIYKNKNTQNTPLEMRTFSHPVVKIFNKYGFGWGGAFSDYMHFSCKTTKIKINEKEELKGS